MKYFKPSEFICPCCGLNNMNRDFLSMLDIARSIAEIPFKINSACRCEKHNIEVGGEIDSSHLKGLAVDIVADNNIKRFKIVKALIEVGFVRILIYPTFVHVDNDLEKDYPIIKLMR